MRSSQFAKNTSLVLTRLIVGAVSTLFITSYLARTLGPDANGIYALAILCPMLAIAIGNLGIAPASVYLISNGKFTVNEVVNKNIVFSLIATGTVVLIGMLVIILFNEKLFPKVPFEILGLALFFSFPLMLFGNLTAVFQGQQNFKLHGLYTFLPQIITAIVILLGFFAFEQKLNVAVIAWGGGYTLALAAIIFHFKKEISNFRRTVLKRSNYYNEVLRYGLKAHIANLITFLNYRSDVFLLGILAGSHAVGIYAVTVPITESIWLVSSAASSVLFPLIAKQQSENSSKNPTPIVCRWVLFVTALVAFTITLISDVLVKTFFGAAFSQSVDVIFWLMPGVVFWSVARVLSNDIAGRGRTEINLYISMAALVINLISNLILIPKMGVLGAALASSISYTLLTIIVILIYSKMVKVKIIELILPQTSDYFFIKKIFIK